MQISQARMGSQIPLPDLRLELVSLSGKEWLELSQPATGPDDQVVLISVDHLDELITALGRQLVFLRPRNSTSDSWKARCRD